MTKRKPRVLVVDDRPDAIEVLMSLLIQCDLTTVADSIEAARLAEEEEFDLIIAGYAIPPVTGIESIACKTKTDSGLGKERNSVLELRKWLEEAEGIIKSKGDVAEQLLMESRVRQEKILESLRDHVRRIDAERLELKEEADSLRAELDSSLQRNGDLEREAAEVKEEMTRKTGELQQSVGSLTVELEDAVALAEAIQKERTATESELARLREEAVSAAADSGRKIDSLTESLNEAVARIEAAKGEKADMEAELAWIREESAELREEAKKVEAMMAREKSLTDELKRAVEAAEFARAEKDKLEERLQKLQQNWEKYVAAQ